MEQGHGLLRDIFKETALAYFSVQGGALFSLQLVYYLVQSFSAIPTMKELRTQRYRMLEALKPRGKLRAQIIIATAYLAFTFWYSTYSRLNAAQRQIATLELQAKTKNGPPAGPRSRSRALASEIFAFLRTQEKGCPQWNNQDCRVKTATLFQALYSSRVKWAIEQ